MALARHTPNAPMVAEGDRRARHDGPGRQLRAPGPGSSPRTGCEWYTGRPRRPSDGHGIVQHTEGRAEHGEEPPRGRRSNPNERQWETPGRRPRAGPPCRRLRPDVAGVRAARADT